jgi:hypothetical protein
MTLPTNSSIATLGEVFRTDAPTSATTYWRMLHGGTSIFNINHTNGSNNMNLVSLTSGSMLFHTNNTPFMELNNGGDLNLFTTTTTNASSPDAYQIGGNNVLWHNGTVSNIYVGVGAGANNTKPDNTFIGYNSGNNNTNGTRNVFGGSHAGFTNTDGSNNILLGYAAGYNNDLDTSNLFIGTASGFSNVFGINNVFIGNRAGFTSNGTSTQPSSFHTFIGAQAGFSQTIVPSGSTFASYTGNTFIGGQAGFSNLIGGENAFLGFQAGYFNNGSCNTFMGHKAGLNNSTGGSSGNFGDNNSFFGCSSGIDNTTGKENTFIGSQAGHNNLTGNFNTFIGSGAASTSTSTIYSSVLGWGGDVGGNNATAIGAHTSAPVANTLLLGATGTYAVKVGIGLSGATESNAPQNYLEINADPSSFTYTGAGGSGLSFRQLNQTSSPIPSNSSNTVLSVDANGKVILVNDQTGTGTFNGAQNGVSTNGSNVVELGDAIYTAAGSQKHLLSHREIPMTYYTMTTTDEWNIYFSGQGHMPTTPVDIGVGYTALTSGSPTQLQAKVDVLNISNSEPTFPFVNKYAGRFITTGSFGHSFSDVEMVGVYGQSDVTGSAYQFNNVGGDFEAEQAKTNNVLQLPEERDFYHKT